MHLFSYRFLRLYAATLAIALVCWAVPGCRRPTKGHVTISFLDPEWSNDTSKARKALMDAGLEDFTRETGIEVQHLPAPESAQDQLALIRRLLQQGATGPDVYSIDIVWPGIVAQDLVDLKAYFPTEIKSDDPELIANYTVQGHLVAVPYHTNVGVLWYRTDLLQKYGYKRPPKTWSELEKMAIHIQNGERAAGKRDFWGFIWPGAAGESLTCNALEWQVADGGGRLIEPDGGISVNNPKAVYSWERAAHWVGWVSPPSVLSYHEWDATNAFRNGNSAFYRSWGSDYFLSHPPKNQTIKISGITSLPGPAVLGGNGLAVSRASAHQTEAIQLVRYLLHREEQLEDARAHSKPPEWPILVDLPAVLKAYSHSQQSPYVGSSNVIVRPSTITGENYDRVSRAYFEAVYSVLSKKSAASDEAARLEDELIRITGFRPTPSAVKASVDK